MNLVTVRFGLIILAVLVSTETGMLSAAPEAGLFCWGKEGVDLWLPRSKNCLYCSLFFATWIYLSCFFTNMGGISALLREVRLCSEPPCDLLLVSSWVVSLTTVSFFSIFCTFACCSLARFSFLKWPLLYSDSCFTGNFFSFSVSTHLSLPVSI